MVNDKNLKRVAQQHSQNVANMFAMKKKKGNTSSSDSSSSTSGEFKSPSTTSVASKSEEFTSPSMSSVALTSEEFTSPSTSSVALMSEEFTSPSASQRNQSVTVSTQTFIKNTDKMKPSRPILNSYLKRRFGQETFERQFKANWYDERPWLKYVVDLCFPCRIYSPNSDSSFVRTGFNDWKHPGTEKAPEDPKPKDKDNSKLKGFLRHAVSTRHQTSMKLWEEQKKTSSSSSLSINTMVLTRIPEHRRWVEAVFNVVKYLTVYGLPFRGHDENTDFGSESFGGVVYLNTFGDFLFKLDENPRGGGGGGG